MPRTWQPAPSAVCKNIILQPGNALTCPPLNQLDVTKSAQLLKGPTEPPDLGTHLYVKPTGN